MELSRQSGISKTRMYEICKGRIPPHLEELERLAKLTGIDAGTLFEVKQNGTR
jgi:transcriptional regulator with XRE-family HTH domain